MPISTTKIDRWVNILFPGTDWTDKNRDQRIQVTELSPSLAISPQERPRVQRSIENRFKPLITKLDKNKDGLSPAEIKTYTIPPIDMNFKVNLDKVISELRQRGEYKVPHLPILFVTEDNIPDEVRNIRGSQELIDKHLKSGNPLSLGISKVKGHYQKRTIIGTDKYMVIVFPKMRLQDERVFLINDSLQHELVHAKQYFYGRDDEYCSLVVFMLKSKKIDPYFIKLICHQIPLALREIEAYQRINLKSAIHKRNIKYIKHGCSLINAQLILINLAQQKLRQCGLKELADLIDQFLEEVFPAKEIKRMNDILKSIADKPEYQIHRDITKERFDQLYRRKTN